MVTEGLNINTRVSAVIIVSKFLSLIDADEVLLRTKRAPDNDDYDYITSFQENKNEEIGEDSAIRSERYIHEDGSVAEDDLSNIFRNIVRRRDINTNEDFDKLNDFLNHIKNRELHKRSEETSSRETHFKDEKEASHGDIEINALFVNKRTMEESNGSGGSETEAENGGEWCSYFYITIGLPIRTYVYVVNIAKKLCPR